MLKMEMLLGPTPRGSLSTFRVWGQGLDRIEIVGFCFRVWVVGISSSENGKAKGRGRHAGAFPPLWFGVRLYIALVKSGAGYRGVGCLCVGSENED